MRRFSTAAATFFIFSDVLPDPDCFLSISTRSLARDHANAIYLSHFRRLGIIRFVHDTFLHLLVYQKYLVNIFLGPFGSFLIFARLRTPSIPMNLREAHYGYLFLFSFLSLAHFNIPSINRSASSNPPVSHYPHLNFVQNASFFSLDYVLVEFSSVQARRGYKFALIPCFLPLSLSFSFFLCFSFIRTITLCANRYVLIHYCPLILFVLNPYCSVIRNFLSLSLHHIVPADLRVRDRTNAIYLSYFLSSVPATLPYGRPPFASLQSFSYMYTYTTLSTCLTPSLSPIYSLSLAPFSKFYHFSSSLLEHLSLLLPRLSSRFFAHLLLPPPSLPLAFSQSLRTCANIHVCAAEPRRGGRDGRIV